MTKTSVTVVKPTNGTSNADKAVAEVVKETLKANTEKDNEQKVLPEKTKEMVREMTMVDKINKIENLMLMIEKRNKLVQTRSELDRFKTSSSDFNCTLRLNDSEGNTFSTSFTPGIKKVLDFLRNAFDTSITEVESGINF
jgi:uncharacterized protein YpuA (DUF1002 family)